MRLHRIIPLFALMPFLASAVEIRPAEATLADIKRIYVDQMGGGKTSDQFRDMLIASMEKSGLFVITENQAHADATLKGSGDDLIFTEEHNTNDSLGIHANTGSGSSSRSLNSGVSANSSMGVGVTDSESSRMQERHHEATGSVRLVAKDGDVIWSTTQESNGGKFRSAMADVAEKIMRQLADETRRTRELAALNPTKPAAASDVKPAALVSDAPTPAVTAPAAGATVLATRKAPAAVADDDDDEDEGPPKLTHKATPVK